MSGKPWTPEQKAAAAARMRESWRRGAFRQRKTTVSDAERAARSARTAALNERMRADKALKRKCVAGQKRVRRRKSYRAAQGARMRARMRDRPELRELAREHVCGINRDPEVRRRQWDSRRRNKVNAAAAAIEIKMELAAVSLRRPPLARSDALLERLRQVHGERPHA